MRRTDGQQEIWRTNEKNGPKEIGTLKGIKNEEGRYRSIEAKNLRFCRTEGEIAARMTEYQGAMRTNSRGVEKPDKMLRHLKRLRYLRDNAARLGECLHLPSTPVVRGVMVMEAPQPMNFHELIEDCDATSCM